MSNIKNIDNMYNTVVIGNNHIKFHNEILRISNISRTWIFTFQNIEKMRFEEAERNYEKNKAQFEYNETQNRSIYLVITILGAAFSLLFTVVAFSTVITFSFLSIVIGIFFLCITGILSYVAYRIYYKEIHYPYAPPTEREFPDKFGLSIEMNSGYKVTFTVIGSDGIQALRKLQNSIEDADENRKSIINFNLNENNITVENNDGLINTGDYANNIINKKEQGNI